MKYYKDENDEIYIYEDDVEDECVKEGAILISKKEAESILSKIDEKHSLNEQINEVEIHIRHALIIGNDTVLPELREEYKELLAQKQALEKGSEK